MSNSPKVSIGCVSNLYSRMMVFEKSGDLEQGHFHHFDHLTLLASGSLRVTVKDIPTVFKAPTMIFIKADLKHELVALEDNTVAYCIHALRTPDSDGDILDPDSIPEGVDPLQMAMHLTRL